eukprot:gene2819-3112_t
MSMFVASPRHRLERGPSLPQRWARHCLDLESPSVEIRNSISPAEVSDNRGHQGKLRCQQVMDQQTSCNSQHSGSVVSAVTTKSHHAGSPLLACNSVHSSPTLQSDRPLEDQPAHVSRLTCALQNVLSQGLASDYVEGLRPVLHDGKLQIATYVLLEGTNEPIYIGMYGSLPAAVQAQKQSQALVGQLPADVARKLIKAQLTYTERQQQLLTPAAPKKLGLPGRGLSSNSELTAGHTRTVSASAEDLDDLTPHAAAQHTGQQQGVWTLHTTSPLAAAGPCSAVKAADPCKPAASALAEVPAGPLSPSMAAAAAAAALAATPQQPLAALTDDVIHLLLRKGLHALASAEGFGLNAMAMPLSHSQAVARDMMMSAAMGLGPSTGEDLLPAYPSQQYPTESHQHYPPVLPHYHMAPAQYSGHPMYRTSSTGAGAGAGLPPRSHQPLTDATWGTAAMPQRNYPPPAAGLAAMTGAAGALASTAGCYQEHPQGMMSLQPGLGGVMGSAGGSSSMYRCSSEGGYGFGSSMGGAMSHAEWSDHGSHGGFPGSAARGGGGSSGGGAGGDLKRKRSDPRLNCIKSVQYRVSRFPPELHDLCVEHWERTRCARVVCNGVNGVMSLQGGRCVVSFTQQGQEVLKGVADYLRYAGEDRIKKWRRHVRMVDFPRPNNRPHELMTAEEFLCIVGYQSEQGGGKRPKYMGSSGGGGDSGAGECSE